MSSTCTNCTIVLVLIAERWKAAAPYRNIFETLANRTITMMDDRSDGKQTLPNASTEPENSSEVDLTEWMTRVVNVGMSEGLNELLAGLVSDFPPYR